MITRGKWCGCLVSSTCATCLHCRRKALQEGRKKKLQGKSEAPKEVKPPPELICGICKELMKDAVIIPCCGESYCYECIYEHLCENEFTCPSCKKENISPDNLAPNKALRMVRERERERGGRECMRGYGRD